MNRELPRLLSDLRTQAALWGALAPLASVLPTVALTWAGLQWVSQASQSAGQSAGVGAGLWALLAGARAEVHGVPVAFTPLLGTALVVLAGRWVARRAATRVGARWDAAEEAASEDGEIPVAGLRWAFGAGALVASALVLLLASGSVVSPQLLSALIPVLLWPLLWNFAFTSALWSGEPGLRDLLDQGVGRRPWRLPASLRRGAPIGLKGAAALLLLGALAVLIAVVKGADRIGVINEALGDVGAGAILLWAGQILAWPNLALWALSALTGAGFSIGGGSFVDLSGAKTDLLPMIPILGAHPQAGDFPWWAKLAMLLPVLVGAWMGRASLRAVPRLASTRVKVRTAGMAILLAVLGVVALTWLGGRSLGIGSLAHLGPPMGAFALRLTLLLGLGAAIVVVRDWVQLRK